MTIGFDSGAPSITRATIAATPLAHRSRRTRYTLDVVVPCYNEQETLPRTVPIMIGYMRALSHGGELGLVSARLVLVDDGSSDDSWAIITGLAEANADIAGIRLSRNFGHQGALMAGLSHAGADAVISMDADLQDDITVIAAMLSAYERGSDLVLGVRRKRVSDSLFKRRSAHAYYALLNLLGVRIVENHADYRLMSQKALQALLAYDEVNLFLRGIIPQLGFRTELVHYDRQARQHGETKYTLRKMVSLGLHGITSFSVSPLRLVAVMGVILFLVSLAGAIWVAAVRILEPWAVVPGWASILLPLMAMGAIELLSIGILGEYVGKIYMEVKRRPRFIIDEVMGDGE